MQSAQYWAGFQGWMERSCTGFIDIKNGPFTEIGNNFLYFTLAEWRKQSGLHKDGFRRSTSGVSFLYGLMQYGDAIGYWIFEDLQKGFHVLSPKHTKVLATKITSADLDPNWDLTPYQGNGIGVIDGHVAFWWAIQGRGMAYGVENSGEVNENGKLVDLPGQYTADTYYAGEVSLEVWYFGINTYA